MKPRCTVQQMMKVIRRNMKIALDDFQPEHKLILAIFGCAITDTLDKNLRRSAEVFFNQEGFCRYCDFLNLDPEATRGLLVHGGFLRARKETLALPR